jgi:lipoate---protein ligase
MSMGESVIKKEGGKLIRAFVSFQGDRIDAVRLGGDFFMHPEDAIEKLELSLLGASKEEVRERVASALDGVRVYGVDANSLSEAVLEAMK